MPISLPAKSAERFLVIGYGNERRGDEGVGAMVARAVGRWQLQSVTTLVSSQLTPSHARDVIEANYVIFVDACGNRSGNNNSVKIEPIVGDSQVRRKLSGGMQCLNPWTLLSLTRQRYGHAPQAWLLQVPTEHFDAQRPLSRTALQGCDRATRTIGQFLKTYHQPVYPQLAQQSHKVLSCA